MTAIYADRETFYAPVYQVKAGATSPDHAIGDIVDVSYTDNIRELDQFALTINNWDASRQKFKYEPPCETRFETLFEPMNRVSVEMGYGLNLRPMIRGTITTIEPRYPESGGPTLSIRGLNVMHAFRRRQRSNEWHSARDSEVAIDIARSLGVPIRIDGAALAKEYRDEIRMQSQYEVDFLRQRAKMRGYVFLVEVTPDGTEQLYFGPSHAPARVAYDLEWGKSLVSFQPRLGVTFQAKAVTVRGVDRLTGKAIESTARVGRDCGLNSDLAMELEGEEIITTPPARSLEEARQRACEELTELRRQLVLAEGTTIGLPELRAGSFVNVTLAKGSRFNGRYFITGTTHSIGSGGYTTKFSARREELPQ